MNYTTEIEQYISQLKTKNGNPAGVQEQTRTTNILVAFCENHMQGALKLWPDKEDYDAFRAEIDKPDNPKFATENINRVKKFFAWRTLDILTTSKLNDDECMQCFTVLECVDLGLAMNRAVAILKDIYAKILNGHKWTPATDDEIRTLLGFTACNDTNRLGLDYLHTNDLNTVNIYDQDKARKVFFTWLKGLTTYSLDSQFSFNFKNQYEYALAIIKERLIILNAKNPITINIDATEAHTPAMSESSQPESFGTVEPEAVQAVEEAEYGAADETSTENSQASEKPEAEMITEIEPEETTENQPEAWPEENTPPAPVKKKPGRKRFDTVNGEKKSEKLMLYLTPELIAKIRVWCDMKGISNVSFITGLIEDFLKDKEDKINAFLKMRSEL